MNRLLPTLPALLMFAVSCGHKPESGGTTPAGPAVKVQTLVLQPQRVPEIYEAVGTIRPKLEATVEAKITAVIRAVKVNPGDKVRAGDVLATLDDRDLRAEFEKAKADFERYDALFKKGVASRAEYDAHETKYRLASASLSYATITAPFDGVVVKKSCDVGDLARPGQPLFALEDSQRLRIEADVPERFAPQVNIGTKIEVRVDAYQGKCDAQVGEIVPSADPTSRSFRIKADLHPKKPIKSGMFGRARLTVGERTGLFAPSSAVRERGQLTFIFVAADGRAQMRLVKTGKAFDDQVELLSGVEPGEKLIVNAQGELVDGQPVTE
ncbi:MAG: efflux RND transporter periplasmic adaptor subunit [Verrucomicrobiae bacterium]|nr:efflux RND transporter periplasmic adaptor subunit [Verrucomicrobiae bacterium]